MTHTKKRILAMLLAVVLMFGTLPFSVSADEITINDSSGDVPVLYAQDPFNTVKSEVEGGTNYMTSVGVTREAIVRELESHEDDDFYLGTKYVGGDAQSPNGDTSYNGGKVGMNCAGFISYVLRKAGLDAETTMEIMHRTPVNQYGSGLPYDWLAGASNYKNLIENGNISAYAFRTKQELLSSGLAEKGDIILMWWSNSPGADGADNHIGFFWGEASDDDVMWHSGTEPSSGNQISAITPKTPGSFYILIKIEPLQPKDYTVTLTKTSADVSITQGNSAYSLAGATYNVYEGTSATGSVVATFTTDEAGHATLSTPLEDGTYSVKEVTPPKGYKLDEKIYTFTINGADTNLSVEDEPGTLTLKLKKRDSQTGSTPQGNASLAGAVYQVSYQKGGQTMTEELTSDSSGNLGTLESIPFGTVTVKELTAPEGYRLDTEVHTYTVDGSQLVGDTYTFEVDDLTEDVMRGGLTIQKLDSQTGTTPQGDASLEGIQFEIVNQSTNPVVVNGSTAQPGQVAMTITTNASGVATTGENALPYGEYTVREVSTNDSMLQTFTEEISVTISEDGQMLEYEVENEVVRGGIDIEKQDSEMGTTPQGNSSFAGISFEVVNRSTNPVVVGSQTYAVGDVVMTITTDESGRASTGNDVLPYGTYEVKESSTNESMLLTWQGETVQVRQNGHSVSVTAVDEVERGGLSVEKQDTITGSTPQGDADFSGITFEVINNSRNPVMVEGQKYQPGEVVKTLVTDSEGKASTAHDLLPYGEYILHESTTNESMLLTAPDQTVLVEDDGIIYEFTMANEVVRGGILIEKRDLESRLLTPLGGASLDGTLFEITNKSINAVFVGGALYQPGEVCATIEVVDGIAQTDARALPYGSYQMVETKPGEGYLHTDQTVRSFQIRKDGEVIEFRDGDAAYNQVIRGDLQFVKVGEGGEANMGRFANVAFKLTSQTTGESHIVVTDENGEVRTTTEWNPHSQNTNGNDEITDETLWDDHNGTWFGLTTEGWMVDVQDGLCALPFDTYTLEELPCEGNQGYELVKVPNITISRNNTTIYLGTIDDQFEGIPEIGTTATVDGEHTAEPAGEVTLIDIISYKNLKVGETYKISGVLMDKETGEPLLVNEQQVAAELEFTPTNSEGTVELTYTFDGSALAGKSVVVFEDLYQDENVVASHSDINDEGQTVTFGQPEIRTTATIDGEKTAQPSDQVTITDTVEYSSLTVGQEYTLKGVLMDKSTGEPLQVNDQQVTSEATFIPAEASGTIEVLFTFDASALTGKAVVVFETLFQGETEIASHEDIEDEGQTVTFVEGPKIGTTATVDGQHTAEPTGEITIVDVVEYTGLTPGKTYTISGVLMDKATNQPLLVDGAEVTAEVEFTPESADGTVELTYTLNASTLAGTTIVVFETLYSDGVEIAAHTDINNEAQTVEITEPEKPTLGTTATVDGQHTADPTGEITIVDVVEFTGLIPGETYTVSGVLMDKATGEPLLVDGAEVTAEVEFIPESADGTVELTYTLDASTLAGATIVVFETLYSDGVEIAAHADINDENQTVEITEPEKPTLGTTATVDGKHTAEPTGEITIVDVVEYTGLTPDGTYTISGVLMDKATGEPLLLDGAIVTAEVEFTPESADGTVELTYTLDASALTGTTIVVFETLYSDGVEIAAHTDINDEAQTITINPKGGLLIQKTSEDGALEGFTFLVEGEGYSETFTTDGAGTIYIEDLAPGEYTVTEQESELTARYEIPAGQTVTVTAEEATTVEFYNALLRGKITGHKTGAEQAPLAGVTFGLFPAEATEFTAENAIEVTSSNEAGEFSFEAPYGNYQVAELETVPGYVTMKESIAVEVNKTDVDLEDIANSQTVVHFSKVDKDTGEELPGAVLELYAPDGSLLDTWETSDIPHVIPGLPVGEGYVLREVTAPEGFEVAEDVTFNVEDTTEIQTITMEDEHTPEEPEEPDEPQTPEEPDEPTPSVPQTGGSRAVIWVTGLLILALLGLCITVPLLRHINKQ
ncbi:MAG: VaFE repeat-containing surface-anchored protein [Acutalibacter sp.]